METISSDLVIAGAGPAGATMALMLAGSGLKVTVVDKDRFPRNKICGDALSGKVLSILKRMPADFPRHEANGSCSVLRGRRVRTAITYGNSCRDRPTRPGRRLHKSPVRQANRLDSRTISFIMEGEVVSRIG